MLFLWIVVIFVLILVLEGAWAYPWKALHFQSPDRETSILGKGPKLTYVVLGDSTAAGIGGEYQKGIAVQTAKSLAQQYTVHMTNVGVSGARIKSILDDQVKEAIKLKPDVVLITGGANDVTHLTSLSMVEKSLIKVIKTLQSSNPDMKIIFTGLPDVGLIPRFPQPLRFLLGLRGKQINKLYSRVIQEQGAILSPLMEETAPIYKKDRSLFAEDKIHPNDRGYAVFIPVINRTLSQALAFNK